MNASIDGSGSFSAARLLTLILCGFSLLAPSGAAQAQLLRGALGGAIIGGIIGGDDGAAAGAIVGGIGGAARANQRRSREMQRREAYARREMERQRAMEEERLRLARERNQILAASQQRAKTGPATRSADTTLVRQTQSALTLMGFEIGVADGVLDDETVVAIRSYQQSFNLLATGAPSAELLQHMKQHL